MLTEDFEKLLDMWYNQMMELHRRKGHDYATKGDMLANFKRVHKACQLYDINPSERPEDVFWFYLFIKIDRIRNLIQAGEAPDCESISDSYKDMILYLRLTMAYNVEQSEGLQEILADALKNRPPTKETT